MAFDAGWNWRIVWRRTVRASQQVWISASHQVCRKIFKNESKKSMFLLATFQSLGLVFRVKKLSCKVCAAVNKEVGNHCSSTSRKSCSMCSGLRFWENVQQFASDIKDRTKLVFLLTVVIVTYSNRLIGFSIESALSVTKQRVNVLISKSL